MKAFFIYWKAKFFGETITREKAAMQVHDTNIEQTVCAFFDELFMSIREVKYAAQQATYTFFCAIGQVSNAITGWWQATAFYRFTH